MSYTVSPGIPESGLKPLLENTLKKHGRYQGQGVDFTHAKLAPVVMCTVVCGNQLLLVKRGMGLADAEGYWSTIDGFIDEIRPVIEIAQKELEEEAGVRVHQDAIRVGNSYTLASPSLRRRYIIFPCLVTLKNKPDIVLDYEHTDYTWITRDQLETYHILGDLPHAIDAALNLYDR